MRVLVLYCEEGAGHRSAALALARALARERGAEVVVRDALDGGLGRLIPLLSRDVYRLQVRWLRWTYGLEFALFARWPVGVWIARAGMALFGGRPLRRLVRAHDPDLVVSTHPATTAVLGRLRRSGRLRVPLVATVTDFGVHPLWAHRGADLHLVMHESCVAPVERVAGPGSAAVAAPPLRDEFSPPADQGLARRALGLPVEGRVAVVTGGGWGVGDVVGAVEAALALDDLYVVALAGKSRTLRARLETRFASHPRVRVLGFTERMGQLLPAADVLVDASIGVTCLEALAVGCRIVACAVPPGHSRANARALAAAGLARLALRPRDLARELQAALADDAVNAARLAGGVSAASLIGTVRPRQRPRVGRPRPVLVGVGAVSATLALAGWTLASPTPYPLVANALDLQPLRQVSANDAAVAVVVHTDPRTLVRLAHVLERRGISATFAVDAKPSRRALAAVRAAGDEVLPACASAGPTALLRRERQLRHLASSLGSRGRYYYLAPGSGFSFAEYLAIRSTGGVPVAGSVTLDGHEAAARARVRAGSIIVVGLGPRKPERMLRQLTTLTRERGLEPVSLSTLLASDRSA